MARETSGKAISAIYRVVDEIFERRSDGSQRIEFTRQDIEDTAKMLGVKLARNVPDLPYNFNFRRSSRSSAMLNTESKQKRWYIVPVPGGYAFELDRLPFIPDPKLPVTEVPNATPDFIGAYSLTDEQAVLATVRYNRLIDAFIGVTAYPLQSHIRTKVDKVQIEVDEVYLGVSGKGERFAIGVEAKVEDSLVPYQIRNCYALLRKEFQDLTPIVVGIKWNGNNSSIAMMRMVESGKGGRTIRVADETHYGIVQLPRKVGPKPRPRPTSE